MPQEGQKKPCTHPGCTGTMTYSQNGVSVPQGSGTGDASGKIKWQPGTRAGWVCDKVRTHVEREP